MRRILSCLRTSSGQRLIMVTTAAALVGLTVYWLSPARFRQTIEPHAQAATFTVTNTNNSGAGSLRNAIATAETDAAADTIVFNIPPTDPRHFYYQNNGVAGTVSQAMIAVTSAADDSTIANIDPDWAHSWYSISTDGARFSIGTAMTIDGYTQPGAQPNTNASGGLNTILRIEVTNGSGSCPDIFTTFTSAHTIKGLIINRCESPQSKAINFDVGNAGSIASGNFIGTDPSGTIVLVNGKGVEVQRSSGVVIGGNSPADRNLISGNYTGVSITNGGGSGDSVSNVSVIGNLVGTARDGVTALGNGFHPSLPTFPLDGIIISAVNGFALNNRVENNVIAYSARYGIELASGGVGSNSTVTGNRFINNSIFSNGSIGIDFQAGNTAETPVSPNDPCDTDAGENNRQNFPVLSSTAISGSNLNIKGTLDSIAGGTFTIHFYSSPTLDPSGFGEGKTPLGSISVTDSDSNCAMSFSATVPRPAAAETIITATATDTAGNTSEFSSSVKVTNAPFDFDGDLKTDISIFRPGVAEWWYARSSDNQIRAAQFGQSTDIITPADFTGDGKTDIALFRPSTGFWFILRSEDGSFFSFPFGQSGDIPVPSDFDADGKADAAVFRPSSSTWFISNSGGSGTAIVTFGQTGDKPVAADYDGDGKADIAIFRPSDGSWWYLQSSNLQFKVFRFGVGTDKPVQGYYTADNRADIAVFRPSTGVWYIQRSEDNSFYSLPFGTNGDIPTPGDYDGDGQFDTAVFRPSQANWFVQRSTAGFFALQFGLGTDKPIPSAFIP